MKKKQLLDIQRGNAMAGLAHSMAYAFGVLFHTPHGRAVALFLPYTMDYLVVAATDFCAEINRWIGITAPKENTVNGYSGKLLVLISSLSCFSVPKPYHPDDTC